MTATKVSPQPEPQWPAETLLAAVTSGLSVAREPRLLRQRFEEELRVLVRARSVAVRDARRDAPDPDVLRFDVPSAPWATPTRLEAVFEPAQTVDEWQRRTLSFGAQVARCSSRSSRADGRWSRSPRRTAPRR